jgi:hypothetical protein
LQRSLEVLKALANPVENGAYVATYALDAIDGLGAKAESLKPYLATLPKEDPDSPSRARGYSGRLLSTLLGE